MVQRTRAAVEDADDVGIYEFGDFELDPRRALLRSLSTGAVVDLTPKAFAVLQHLVANAGRVVAKAELLSAVWPNVVVEESNLTQSVHRVRRALREVPDDHRYVVTLPGRGYRFVAPVALRTASRSDRRSEPARSAQATPAHAAPVPDGAVAGTALPEFPEGGSAGPSRPIVGGATAAEPADAAPPQFTAPPRPTSRVRRRFLVAAAALAVAALAAASALYAWRTRESAPAAVVQPTSIAVLPFVDLSPARDRAYFADGLAEEVLDRLARVPDLRVIARTSSFAFRGRDADVATIGRTLGVEHVLEGSIRTDGRRLRVTTHLIEARDSSEVWSQTFDGPVTGVFELQEEIASAVAAALSARLVATRMAGAAAPDPRAYEHVLRGQYFLARRGEGDLSRAAEQYETATAIDARYARAWAGLASATFLRIGEHEIPREAGLPRLHEAASRAVRLDPRLADGHFRMAAYHHLVGDTEQAARSFARGAGLVPDHPLALGRRAGAAMERGDFAAAITLLSRVAAVDPLSVATLNNLGYAYFLAGRYDEAEARLRTAADLSGSSGSLALLAQTRIVRGDLDGARALVEGANPSARRDACLAMIHHAQGRAAESDAALRRLVEVAGEREPFVVAEVHAYRGEPGPAFEWLERAARDAHAAARGVPLASNQTVAEMRASPFLRRLHADPRWQTWSG